MRPANDRLEVPDIERPRIEVSVPPDDVERMVVEDELVDSVVLLHVEGEVAFLVDGLQVAGSPPKSGSFELPLRCDGSAHTVILSVVDDQGLFAVKSKAILTTMPAGPPASSEPAPSN